MTPQDDWRPEMARLTQRQDQLERQQRETTTRVDALNRDVDRRMDSQRGEMDRQFRDGERKVGSLERSRDTLGFLISLCIPLIAAFAMIIILVIAVIVSREQRQEPGEPEQRSPSSIDAPVASFGGPLPPGLAAAGTPFRQSHRRPRDLGRRAREPNAFNPSTREEQPLIEYQLCRIDRAHSPIRYPLRYPARGPCFAKPLLTTQRPAPCRR